VANEPTTPPPGTVKPPAPPRFQPMPFYLSANARTYRGEVPVTPHHQPDAPAAFVGIPLEELTHLVLVPVDREILPEFSQWRGPFHVRLEPTGEPTPQLMFRQFHPTLTAAVLERLWDAIPSNGSASRYWCELTKEAQAELVAFADAVLAEATRG
jgi:hypothetical protein